MPTKASSGRSNSVPALPDRRLDADARRGAQDGGAVGGGLGGEELEAGRRDHGGADALSPPAGRRRPGRSRTSEPVAISVTSRGRPHRAGHRRPCAVRFSPASVAHQRQVLPATAPAASACRSRSSRSPRPRRFPPRRRGADTVRFGMARSEARCSTGWCVGPSSPRPMRVMRHHIGRPARPSAPTAGSPGGSSRQRPGRCRHRGGTAAVQRDAVHRRRHAVFADAVVDVAAGDSRRASPSFWPLVRVRFDPVRSAEPPTVKGSAAFTTSSAISLALRVATLGLSARSLRLVGRHRRGQRGRIGAPARPRRPRGRARRPARFPGGAGRSAARGDLGPGGTDVVRHLEGRMGPAQRLRGRRRSRRRPAARRARRGCPACWARRSR